jgi:hypothetical protein
MQPIFRPLRAATRKLLAQHLCRAACDGVPAEAQARVIRRTLYGCDKAVATAGIVCDVMQAVATRIECPTKSGNVYPWICRVDGGIGPGS